VESSNKGVARQSGVSYWRILLQKSVETSRQA
jgi:hypothetical protein